MLRIIIAEPDPRGGPATAMVDMRSGHERALRELAGAMVGGHRLRIREARPLDIATLMLPAG